MWVRVAALALGSHQRRSPPHGRESRLSGRNKGTQDYTDLRMLDSWRVRPGAACPGRTLRGVERERDGQALPMLAHRRRNGSVGVNSEVSASGSMSPTRVFQAANSATLLLTSDGCPQRGRRGDTPDLRRGASFSDTLATPTGSSSPPTLVGPPNRADVAIWAAQHGPGDFESAVRARPDRPVGHRGRRQHVRPRRPRDSRREGQGRSPSGFGCIRKSDQSRRR